MSLIKKLGKDYFKEKFLRGTFVLNGAVYVLMDVRHALNPQDQLEKNAAELKYRIARSELEDLTIRLDVKNPFTDEKAQKEYTTYVRTALRAGDDYMREEEWAEANEKKLDEEWAALLEKTEALEKAVNEAKHELAGLQAREKQTKAIECLAVNLSNGKTETLSEDCFENMKMFGTLTKGVKVLPANKLVGMVITEPDVGARCLKLEQCLSHELHIEDKLARNYGYYIENSRWTHLLKPKGTTIHTAIKALQTEHSQGCVLLEKEACVMTKGSVKGQYNVLYKDLVVAVLDADGDVVKIREKLYKNLEQADMAPTL